MMIIQLASQPAEQRAAQGRANSLRMEEVVCFDIGKMLTIRLA